MNIVEKGIIYIKEGNTMLVKSLVGQGLTKDELKKLYTFACVFPNNETMVELSKHVDKDIAKFALFASSEKAIPESVKFNKKLIESFDKQC